jgi:hypothetical protein
VLFFRFPGPGVVGRRWCVLTCFPCAGAHLMWRHHTRMEARSPLAWRVQSTSGMRLCSLARRLSPRPVLFIHVAASRGVRQGGAAHVQPSATSAVYALLAQRAEPALRLSGAAQRQGYAYG